MTNHDSQSKPNLLYLVHRVPFPPNRGDRIRSCHLLRFLAGYAKVHLACLADEPLEPGTEEALGRLCETVAIVPLGRRGRWFQAVRHVASGRTATEGLFHSDSLRKVVGSWARTVDFEAAVVFCSSMVQYLDAPELASVPTIVDLVDVDSQKWFDYAGAAGGLKRWLFRLEGRRLRALERSLPERFRAITLVSEAEAEIYRGIVSNTRTLGISNGVDLDYFSPMSVSEAEDPNVCVFVGALDYRANVEGLRWFCGEVWPGLHKSNPDLRLELVGRSPVPAVTRLGRIPGVHLVGAVDDVRGYLARAAVAIAPLQIARGIQNKVLEAMAMSRPVVASPEALEGLAVEVETHVCRASSPAEWQAHLLRLHGQSDERRRLGYRARQYVERHHSWNACLAPFEGLLGWESGRSSPSTAQPRRHPDR